MNKNLTHQIPRAALTLLLMLTMSLTASASALFITDVMVAGHSDQSSFNTLIQDLQQQGWIDIEQDLNEGVGGDYIHLLYKTNSSTGSSGTAITDFYIKTGNNPPATLIHQGRIYYLTPYQGDTYFVNSQGDLNKDAGGDYIYLYYTKDAMSNHTVSSIFFNNNPIGAIGANGGDIGYDLNSNCTHNYGNVHIYMHVIKPFNQPQSYLDECTGGPGKIHVQGWTYDPDAPSESLDVEVYIYTDSDYSNLYMPAQLIHADVPRPDVNSYFNITGDHGFQADITVADAGDYWVKLYAIDHDGGTNPLIGSAAVTVTAVTLVTLTSESGVVLLHDGDTLTGTGGTETQVRIADGATVLFSGVDITAIPNNSSHRWAGITCLGDAVIVLDAGTTNGVKGGSHSSGLYVAQGHTLTIQGNGTLNAWGNGEGAGIGSGGSYSSCGNITISGGTVTANGGYYAAGIGSGRSNSSCGNITITNGVTRVTATAGSGCNNAIGAGVYSTCGTVTIGGVQTGYITQSPYTTFPYTVSFDTNGGTGTMDNMDFMYNFPQYLPGNNFTYSGLWFDGWATLANGPRVYYNRQNVSNLTTTPGDTVTLYAAWKETNVVWLTSESGEVVLHDGEVLIGTGGPSTQVKIVYGATVTLNGVNITAIPNNSSHRWAGITCLGDAVIVLAEGTTNSVKGGKDNPGIYVPQNKTLTLQGSGTLNATGGGSGAGIGSGYQQSCGNITINGGTVTATGGQNAAGIGSGKKNSSCGDITISGGTVTATGGDYAAGIGSGDHFSCGDIAISGGIVTATGDKWAAGIGSGHYSSCGTITITNGVNMVTATAGQDCNNTIGAGKNSTCGTVTIDGVETGFITENPYTILTKEIAGYGTGSGGWQLIASPVYDTLALPTISNMIADSATHYDLYRFDPSNEGNEWENYKNESFNLVNGQGYIYANVDTVILVFRGMPYIGDSCEVVLSYDADDEHKCWNLVGNPFNGEAMLDRQYYIMKADGKGIKPVAIPSSTPIPPCTAVFVKAVSVGDRAVFTRVTQ